MEIPLTSKTHYHGPVPMRLFYFFKEQADVYFVCCPVEPGHNIGHTLSHTLKHANMLVNRDTKVKVLSLVSLDNMVRQRIDGNRKSV